MAPDITSQFDSVHVLEAILDGLASTKLNGKPLYERLGFKDVGVVTKLICKKCGQHAMLPMTMIP